MIIVAFAGGLGNQMFQYAFYKALQTKYPAVQVKADLNNYEIHKYHHGFELEKIFDVHLNLAGGTKKQNIFYSVIKKIINNQTRFICEREEDYRDFNHEYLNLDMKFDYYLSGYWMNELYFNHIAVDLLSDFEVAESVYEKSNVINDIINCESVSVHIRRGDYVNTEHDILTPNYYKRAIIYILKKIENPRFFIFSDDVAYVESHLNFIKNKVVVTENQGINSYKDMLFMSRCKHNIIANSTFSFWGAYLNKNRNKIVIAPDCYNACLANDKNLSCKKWVTIEH